jgi:Family of unknown function (DUF6084)
MPDLQFRVEDISATSHAATPQLTSKLRIVNFQPEPIHSIALRVQVQIEPVRRRYSADERARLKELFGEPEQWSKSLTPLLWTNASLNVPGFNDSTVVDLPLPCAFDFNIAMTKYIYGLEAGELPISFLFSGTIFFPGSMGLQIAQIPWDREARYQLPVQVWKEMMNLYYSNSAWLCLPRDIFDQLYDFKTRHGIPTWEQAFERLLGVTAGAKS